MEKMGFKNLNTNFEFEVETKLNLKSVNRQIFINKFIEKFPRAKLHNLTQVNKYYNKKICLNEINSNQLINTN